MLSRPLVSNASIVLKNSSMMHSSFEEQYATNENFKDIYVALIQGKQVEEKDYYVHDKLLYHLGKLCITKNEQAHVIIEAHTLLIAGHFGVSKILAQLQKYWYWPQMQEIVTKCIKGCVMCATSKPSNRKLGLYTPLPVPSRPWESVSMDFIRGLPISRKGHDYLYVIVDQFNKMCILMPCKNQVTTELTAHMYFNFVWVHFGLPTSIVLDRDSPFLGEFWSVLWGLMNTKLEKSTAFHPQTNGQTEVSNMTVVHLLRGYCNKHPKFWDESLHYVQHAYNHVAHYSTKRSPFETCFDYLPKTPMDFTFGTNDVEDGCLDAERDLNFIQKVQAVHQAIEAQLEKSQAKYKAHHEKHRSDHHFQVGDRVWLHISKERMQGEGRKLKLIRYGPFKILEKIGTNAFRLNLPPYMQIYSVVNVENLKLYEPLMILDEEA